MATKDTTAPFSKKLQPRKLLLALAIGVVLFYAIGIFVRCSQGIRVILHNESGVILEDATIKFENGKQYSLGEIAPGKSRKLFVISGSKSNIRLDFADPNGHIHSEIVAGYVENGYCGAVKVQILPDLRIQSLDKSFAMNWQSWFGFLN